MFRKKNPLKRTGYDQKKINLKWFPTLELFSVSMRAWHEVKISHPRVVYIPGGAGFLPSTVGGLEFGSSIYNFSNLVEPDSCICSNLGPSFWPRSITLTKPNKHLATSQTTNVQPNTHIQPSPSCCLSTPCRNLLPQLFPATLFQPVSGRGVPNIRWIWHFKIPKR